MCVAVRKDAYHTMSIAYRWWGRVVRHIVIGCVDVWWMPHFTVHSPGLKDALLIGAFKLLVTNSHMKVLKKYMHGFSDDN